MKAILFRAAGDDWAEVIAARAMTWHTQLAVIAAREGAKSVDIFELRERQTGT